MSFRGKLPGSTFVPRRPAGPPGPPEVAFFDRSPDGYILTAPASQTITAWQLSIDGGPFMDHPPISSGTDAGTTYYTFATSETLTIQNTQRAFNGAAFTDQIIPADEDLPLATNVTDLAVVDEEVDSTTCAWTPTGELDIKVQSQFRNDLDEEWTDGAQGSMDDGAVLFDAVDNTANAYGYRLEISGKTTQRVYQAFTSVISNVCNTEPLP